MKIPFISICTFLIAICVDAQTPDFFLPESLDIGGTIIKMGLQSAPFIFDWDNDGKKDLIAGQLLYGYVIVCPNIGTDADPVLDNGFLVYADGVPIEMPAG